MVMARGKSLVPRPWQRGHCYQAEHSRQHMVVTSQVRSYVACYSPNVGQSSSEHSFFLHEDMSCESWRMWHRVEAGRVGSFFYTYYKIKSGHWHFAQGGGVPL